MYQALSPTALSAATYLFDETRNRKRQLEHEEDVQRGSCGSGVGDSRVGGGRGRGGRGSGSKSSKTRRIDTAGGDGGGRGRGFGMHVASEGKGRWGTTGLNTHSQEYVPVRGVPSSSPSSSPPFLQTSIHPPPPQSPILSGAQLNAHKLRTRLRVALYKVQTNQTHKPIECLKLPSDQHLRSQYRMAQLALSSPEEASAVRILVNSAPPESPLQVSSFLRKEDSGLSFVSVQTEVTEKDSADADPGLDAEERHHRQQQQRGYNAYIQTTPRKSSGYGGRGVEGLAETPSNKRTVAVAVAETPKAKAVCNAAATQAVIDALTGLGSPPPTCRQAPRDMQAMLAPQESPTRAGRVERERGRVVPGG